MFVDYEIHTQNTANRIQEVRLMTQPVNYNRQIHQRILTTEHGWVVERIYRDKTSLFLVPRTIRSKEAFEFGTLEEAIEKRKELRLERSNRVKKKPDFIDGVSTRGVQIYQLKDGRFRYRVARGVLNREVAIYSTLLEAAAAVVACNAGENMPDPIKEAILKKPRKSRYRLRPLDDC